jgi:hypothetical protein
MSSEKKVVSHTTTKSSLDVEVRKEFDFSFYHCRTLHEVLAIPKLMRELGTSVKKCPN